MAARRMDPKDWEAFTPLQQEVYNLFACAHQHKQTPEKVLKILNARRADVRQEFTIKIVWDIFDDGLLTKYIRRVDRFSWILK